MLKENITEKQLNNSDSNDIPLVFVIYVAIKRRKLQEPDYI